MSAFHDNALLGASGQQGYKISRSVRLRSSASAYLNRTFGSGSRTTWTWNCWVKRGAVGVVYPTTNYAQALFGLNDSDKIYFYEDALWVYLGTGATYTAQPSDKFRDPSAWYHIVVVLDTTNATSGDRVRIYVNNRRVTISQTMPTQNWASSNFNSAINHNIGKADNSNLYYLDAYLTEIHFIDGQALTPSSFGETDTATGVWKPKKYTGTYGTNGFYLNFSDNSSNTSTTIGKDYSGNGNNWTPNNISVTAGVTYDSMVDSPTVGATSSNYCTLNPLRYGTGASSTSTVSEANLKFNSSGNAGTIIGTMAIPSTGKWYWEVVVPTQTYNYCMVGVISNQEALSSLAGGVGYLSTGYGVYSVNGQKYNNSSASAYMASTAQNTVITVAFDADTGSLYVGAGGSWANGTGSTNQTWANAVAAFTSLTGTITPATSFDTGFFNINFGQRPFAYTPPTGFVALNTQNLPTPTISNGANYMAATTYTGNASTQTISNAVNGISFQPDLVWTKSRGNAYSHDLYDSVRGVNKKLQSNQTAAETTVADSLTSFNSNGYTLGTQDNSNYTNGSAAVGWQWKAGGSTVSNTSGTITSTVSAGATQGFSVVTWTGNGTNGATVGHGLGVAPKMVIVKRRSAIESWGVYHASLTSAAYYLILNSTAAQDSGGATIWNSTAPTSTLLTLGTSTYSNANTSTYVAYCFAEVAGYSAFGKYTGNGSADGPFVYCGFRPRFILFKSSSAINSWAMYDTSRSTSNTSTARLYADTSAAETTGLQIDVLSNGFKWREAGGQGNDSGATYIFAAFAENPFKISLAR